MRRGRHALLGLCLAGLPAPDAVAEAPRAVFDEAMRFDLAGEGQAAFALFRRAAEAGLPEAEFNVAAMLDSGRGTAQDPAGAALWYGRAAIHGSRRAAYDLGQLYESGEGVPRNADLARAWFAASDLPAARGRTIAPDALDGGAVLSRPIPVTPPSGIAVMAEPGGVPLVWTSPPQPEPVRFLVEVRRLDPSSSREVFSGTTDLSALLALPAEPGGTYAWRVSAVAAGSGRYSVGPWIHFRVDPAVGATPPPGP